MRSEHSLNRRRSGPAILRTLMLSGLVGAMALATPLRALAQDAGEAQFKTSCGVCHSAEKDAPARQGPNLNSVFGRSAGQLPGFKYSDAMRASKLVWDEATLDKYLEDPIEVVPGSVMPYKQANPDKRKLVIGYLKSLKTQ